MKRLTTMVLGLLCGAAGALSAVAQTPGTAVDDLSRQLLTDAGYSVTADGQVANGVGVRVEPADLPAAVARAASARRLKILFQIDGIVNRYSSEKKIPTEDRDAIRALARVGWPVFGDGARRNLRSFFSAEELDALDRIPARYVSQGVLSVADLAAPASPAAASAPAVAPTPVAAPAAALGIAKPWTPPAGSSTTLAALIAVSTKAVAPAVTAPVATIATVTAVAPATAAPAAAPAPPPLREVSAAEYDAFVSSGPYSKEGRALLELIGRRAPSFCLPLLRRTVVSAIPQIVIAAGRGTGARAEILEDPSHPETPPIAAVSAGPILWRSRGSMFTRPTEIILPDSADGWTALGFTRPGLGVFSADSAAAKAESGDWGEEKRFPDGSVRGTYSPEERAGELLEQLLLLGVRREISASPSYAASRWAHTARLLFSAALARDGRSDGFLDPARRAELHAWLDHPDELDDETAASWSASRVWRLDPRRGTADAEREALEHRSVSDCARTVLEDALADVGRERRRRSETARMLGETNVLRAADVAAVVDAATARARTEEGRILAARPPCPANSARVDVLRRLGVLAADAARAERLFRDHGDDRAH